MERFVATGKQFEGEILPSEGCAILHSRDPSCTDVIDVNMIIQLEGATADEAIIHLQDQHRLVSLGTIHSYGVPFVHFIPWGAYQLPLPHKKISE